MTSDGVGLPPAFAPLLIKIKKNLDVLRAKYEYDWFPLVEYCIKYGKIQQGITQLQEGLISEFCKFSSLNPSVIADRELISQGINIKISKIPFENWKQEAKNNLAIIQELPHCLE